MDPLIYDRTLIRSVYNRSPLLLQHCLVSAYGLLKRLERRGPVFRGYATELDRTQWWTRGKLEALQDERLQTLVKHTYEHVPYYRRVFDERKLKPSDIRSPDDLYALPVLTKQDIRRYHRELRADNVPDRLVAVGRTGGTTGTPLEFALDRRRVIFDRALTHRQWTWAGYRSNDRLVLIRGFTLIPAEARSGVYWRYDWADHRIYLSGFHLSPEILALYVRKLGEWRPKFIAGYPSNIYLLARFMERAGVCIPVKAIFTSSETVTPTERQVIERQFATSVWDRYGTGERLVVAQQCGYGAYHQNMEFGVLQVDSPRGQPAATGTKGELIQTSLTNFSMPLIRYASDDVGFVVNEHCPCGRGSTLMGTVDGRKDGIIVTTDGRMMPRAGLDQIHEYAPGIERCQLVQPRIGEVMIRIMPGVDFTTADTDSLVRELRRRLADRTQIRVDMVEELPLSVTGKNRFIVSDVDVDDVSGLQLEIQTA